MRHAQVAAKLQAILRPNPKRARPSCRKKSRQAKREESVRIKEEKCDEPSTSLSVARSNREVWEVDSEGSDVELLWASMSERPGGGNDASWLRYETFVKVFLATLNFARFHMLLCRLWLLRPRPRILGISFRTQLQ